MINVRELERRPGAYPSRRKIDNLPSLDDGTIRHSIGEKIEIVKAGTTTDLSLCKISAEDRQQVVLIDSTGQAIGKAKPEAIQKAGFQVMQEYGLEDETFVSDPKKVDYKSPDGMMTEYRVYPSLTVSGLGFRRTRVYFEETDKNESVSWDVCNSSKPAEKRHPITRTVLGVIHFLTRK